MNYQTLFTDDSSVRPQTVVVSTNMEKHEREIREEESQRRYHGANNLGTFGKHLRNISEASEKHLGDIWGDLACRSG